MSIYLHLCAIPTFISGEATSIVRSQKDLTPQDKTGTSGVMCHLVCCHDNHSQLTMPLPMILSQRLGARFSHIFLIENTEPTDEISLHNNKKKQ